MSPFRLNLGLVDLALGEETLGGGELGLPDITAGGVSPRKGPIAAGGSGVGQKTDAQILYGLVR